jgi:hypothetical protein
MGPVPWLSPALPDRRPHILPKAVLASAIRAAAAAPERSVARARHQRLNDTYNAVCGKDGGLRQSMVASCLQGTVSRASINSLTSGATAP